MVRENTGCRLKAVRLLGKTVPGRALSKRAPSSGLFRTNTLTAYSLNNLLLLTAILTLCAFATACGRRTAAPTTDHRPPTSDSPVAPTSGLPPSTSHFPTPPATNHLLQSSTIHHPPSTSHLPPSSPSPARQVSALVRSADDAVRATPAGSNAWARVLQARGAYEDVLRQDGEYRDLLAKLARIDDVAATNAPGDAEAVGTAMAQREQTLVRDLPEAARARTAVELAERYYGTLVQADARYVESVRLIEEMGTNEAPAKAPQQDVEKGIRP